MFSATFAEAVREVAKWFAKDPVHLTIGGIHAPATCTLTIPLTLTLAPTLT